MARNIERDKKDVIYRKKQIIEAGFELFSTNGIKKVSLQIVADRAEVGVATLYKYYQTKTNLLVAISAYIWKDFMTKAFEESDYDEIKKYDAYQLIELYCDKIIGLYSERKDILRFSSEYKTYINENGISNELLKEQIEALEPVSELFYSRYEATKQSKNIRADISKEELFTTVSLTMLCMAERFAQGVVWAKNEEDVYYNELRNVKEMILLWTKGK